MAYPVLVSRAQHRLSFPVETLVDIKGRKVPVNTHPRMSSDNSATRPFNP